MARNRTVKPEFFDDEDLAEYPFWIRILFEGLWCYADKAGRLEDRPARLKAKIFPYDKKLDFEKGLEALTHPKKHSPTHKPFIIRYSVNGENYLQIVEFLKHQSPHHTEKDSVIPSPNGDLTVREPLQKGQGGDEQDSESESESESESKNKTPTPQREFESFWEAYPKRVAKQDALKAYTALRKTTALADIASAVNGYNAVIKREQRDPKFIMYPATFLRNEKWRDFVGVKYSPPL
jgi:hypothetical protein